MFQKLITEKLFKALDKIEYGTLNITTPDGATRSFYGCDEIEVNVDIKSWNMLINLSAKGDIGFATSYRDGDFEADNLANLIILSLRNSHCLNNYIYGKSVWGMLSQIMYFMRSNTIKGSRRNILSHYDLGNSFYKLWLDPSMTYSSALFSSDNESLQDAQHNKYDRIVECLDSNSGNLLEIGCGWGGFADRAMHNNDFDIKGITISDEQFNYAKNRLNNKANIALEDYRKQQGKYDSIVSIEMFEAVGEKFWPIYFNKMKSLLNQKGKAVVQTITIDEQYFKQYRKSGDPIRTFIFPGGMLPSELRFKEEVEKAGLKVINNFEFGKDYAKTLQIWLDKFNENISKVKSMGFDDKFIQLWRFYLSTCIAGFTVGRTNVMQSEIIHA